MKRIYTLFIIFYFSASIITYSQSSDAELYKCGIEALNENNTDLAEKYFKESADKEKDAASFYQLGKLNIKKNTPYSRNEALDNLKQAVLRESGNITYRLDYALFLEEFAIHSAVAEYESIIKQFPSNTRALVRLGEINRQRYNEYKNSKKIGIVSDPRCDFDLAEYAMIDFAKAEKYFSKALSIEPLNEDALLGLSRLYENSGNEYKAINLLNKYTELNSSNKDVHLFLGMLYHRKENENSASREFGKALELMSQNEREDFIYNSVVLLITPAYGDKIKQLSKEKIDQTIERFWKAANPLHLSDNNERLIEHYSRIAYANLYFGVPKSGIEGWKTDRGEAVIRFGMPKVRIKTRPYFSDDSVFHTKNENWIYNNFSISFDDYSMNGNFKLSWERPTTNDRGNVHSFEIFEKKKKDLIHSYTPLKKQFSVNNETYHFKSLDNKSKELYDSYLAFELPVRDYSGMLLNIFPKFETGVFIFDRDFNPLLEKRVNYNHDKVERIMADKMNNYKVDVIKFNLPADTASFAFEVRRLSDSSFYSYRTVIWRPDFRRNSFGISNLVLASAVEINREIPGAIKRNDISIVPKVKLIFSNKEPIYLYYEAYNLKTGKDGLTDIEQIITIKEHRENDSESGITSFFRGVKDFFFGAGSKISLSSSGRTKETDSQQYMQMDFSSHPAGKYDLILEVKDKITGQQIAKKLLIEILDSKK